MEGDKGVRLVQEVLFNTNINARFGRGVDIRSQKV